jgi:hypothetical protein
LKAVERRLGNEIDALAYDIELNRARALAADALRIALCIERHLPQKEVSK